MRKPFVFAVLLGCVIEPPQSRADECIDANIRVGRLEVCGQRGGLRSRMVAAGVTVHEGSLSRINNLFSEILFSVPAGVIGSPVPLRVRIRTLVVTPRRRGTDFKERGDTNYELAWWNPNKPECVIPSAKINAPCWRAGSWQWLGNVDF